MSDHCAMTWLGNEGCLWVGSGLRFAGMVDRAEASAARKSVIPWRTVYSDCTFSGSLLARRS
jgi:hypothetical protein